MIPTTGRVPTTTSQATLDAGTRLGRKRIRAMTARVNTMLISVKLKTEDMRELDRKIVIAATGRHLRIISAQTHGGYALDGRTPSCGAPAMNFAAAGGHRKTV